MTTGWPSSLATPDHSRDHSSVWLPVSHCSDTHLVAGEMVKGLGVDVGQGRLSGAVVLGLTTLLLASEVVLEGKGFLQTARFSLTSSSPMLSSSFCDVSKS